MFVFRILTAVGEVVRMTHVGSGVDMNGRFKVDIQVQGYVPMLPNRASIDLMPFYEDYIQTGAGV